MILNHAIQIPRPEKGHPYRVGHAAWKWVLHTVECDSNADLSYAARTHQYPPHFWISPARKQLIQCIDTNLAAQALARVPNGVETNHAHAIQVEIAGRAGESHTWPKEWLDWMREVLLEPVAEHHNINLKNYPDFFGTDAGFTIASAHGRQRMSPIDWINFNGICGHQHVPTNDHWDPGKIDIARLVQGDDDMPLSQDDLNKIRAIVQTELGGTNKRLIDLRAAVDAISDKIPLKIPVNGYTTHLRTISENVKKLLNK